MLWATAMIVMTMTVILGLFSGYSTAEAVTFGLFFGPGWLALLTIVALIGRAFGWGGER